MKRIISLALATGLLISSCNLPGSNAPTPQIATAAALTVQAALNTVPLASPPTKSGSGMTAEATSTFSQPMASVGDVVNCRTGPGINYDRVAQILPEQPVRIIGFFPPNYWIVSTINGDCWLSGEFTTPSGDFTAVSTVPAPPTKQGGMPKAPSFTTNGWTWFCNGTGQTDVSLNWKDNASDEKGYRIYRNGELVIELPVDSTFFKESVLYPGGQGLLYKVEAFNEVGAVSASTNPMFCQ